MDNLTIDGNEHFSNTRLNTSKEALRLPGVLCKWEWLKVKSYNVNTNIYLINK